MIMGKYVIVVESGSDVTPELCERYGIVRVPMHVTIGDETVEDGSIEAYRTKCVSTLGASAQVDAPFSAV